jgi:hypothetical protein
MNSKDLAAELRQCRESIAQQDREFEAAAALARAYPDILVGVAPADLAAFDESTVVEAARCEPARRAGPTVATPTGTGLRC